MIIVAQDVKKLRCQRPRVSSVDSTYDLGIDRPARQFGLSGLLIPRLFIHPAIYGSPKEATQRPRLSMRYRTLLRGCAWPRVCGSYPSVRLQILTHMKGRLQ